MVNYVGVLAFKIREEDLLFQEGVQEPSSKSPYFPLVAAACGREPIEQRVGGVVTRGPNTWTLLKTSPPLTQITLLGDIRVIPVSQAECLQ